MFHNYNTRPKKVIEQDVLAKLEQNIIKGTVTLRDEVLNLKDIVINNLQEDKARLHA